MRRRRLLLALPGPPAMSAFPVDVSRQSLWGDAITGHAAKRLIPCAKTRTDFLILRNASRLDWTQGRDSGPAKRVSGYIRQVRCGLVLLRTLTNSMRLASLA